MSEGRVEELARLARLRLEAAEAASLAVDFEKILGFVAQLRQVDVASCEPLVSVNSLETIARSDVPGECLPRAQVLGGAPSGNAGFFKVPKVLD